MKPCGRIAPEEWTAGSVGPEEWESEQAGTGGREGTWSLRPLSESVLGDVSGQANERQMDNRV